NAELRAREHEACPLGDGQSALSSLVTLRGLRRQLGAIDRHIGEFLGDEIAADGDDHEDDRKSEQQVENWFNHCVSPDARCDSGSVMSPSNSANACGR